MCPIVASPGTTLVTRPYRLDGVGGVTASTSGCRCGIICAIVRAASALSIAFRAAARTLTSMVPPVTSGTGKSESHTSAPARGTFHARITQSPIMRGSGSSDRAASGAGRATGG